jgi:hypothetical protein
VITSDFLFFPLINVLSDITAEIAVTMDADVTFVGQRTLLYAGSVTGYQAYVYATNTDGRLTDAAIPASWTASGLVGQLLVMTGGAHIGHTAFVAVDLGAFTASIHSASFGFG